jgi:hypothetical protein
MERVLTCDDGLDYEVIDVLLKFIYIFPLLLQDAVDLLEGPFVTRFLSFSRSSSLVLILNIC